MNLNANSGIKETYFSVVITRADGTVEDLGVIAYYNSNPFKLWIWKLKQYFKRN